jgi:hypothetical protein
MQACFKYIFARCPLTPALPFAAGMSRTNSEVDGPESLGSLGSSGPASAAPPTSHAYTRGVEVVQANISGPGELSLWEFSGQESYFSLYDHFIGKFFFYSYMF